MSSGWLITLAILWAVFNLFAKFKEKVADAEKLEPPEDPTHGGRDRPRLPGATQAEGFSLERVLREIQRVKADAAARGSTVGPADVERVKTTWKQKRPLPTRSQPESGPLGRRSRVALPSADEAMDLEMEVKRPARVEVDQDEVAEQLVERRIAEAEARNRPLGEADHQAFDKQVREQPAAKTRIAGFSVRDLRNAVVWREILGPPVGLG